MSKQTEEVVAARNAAQETAVLLNRVFRKPPSLAGYHYHIEPGKLVYIHARYQNNDGLPCAIVATMPDTDCVSEDYFRVNISSLAIQ